MRYNRGRWIFEETRWIFIRIVHKISGKYLIKRDRYGKYPLYNAEDCNSMIYKSILQGAGFAFCRFSFVEMDILIRCKTEELFGIKTYMKKKDVVDMFQVAGQGKNLGIRKFNELMLKSIHNADMLGVWTNLPMGDAFINSLDISNKYFVDAIGVEPYCYERPWSEALKGKKVLVVSPFSEEIKEQYKKREYLWKNKRVLPEFELKTVDSVWYFFNQKDSRFSSWFEAYEYLYCQIVREDFDIALLGCGAFGFPLSAEIKKLGKQAVHMGGAIQILFGIKGKRWDKTGIGQYYNEYWIRPGESSKPKEADKLDDNCYW